MFVLVVARVRKRSVLGVVGGWKRSADVGFGQTPRPSA